MTRPTCRVVSHGVGSTAMDCKESLWPVTVFPMMFQFGAVPLCLSSANALHVHGSVRETKGAKDRRAPTEDPPRLANCGTADAAGTSGGEARGSRRASRNQKGCAATIERTVAARTRRAGITVIVAASLPATPEGTKAGAKRTQVVPVGATARRLEATGCRQYDAILCRPGI